MQPYSAGQNAVRATAGTRWDKRRSTQRYQLLLEAAEVVDEQIEQAQLVVQKFGHVLQPRGATA